MSIAIEKDTELSKKIKLRKVTPARACDNCKYVICRIGAGLACGNEAVNELGGHGYYYEVSRNYICKYYVSSNI